MWLINTCIKYLIVRIIKTSNSLSFLYVKNIESTLSTILKYMIKLLSTTVMILCHRVVYFFPACQSLTASANQPIYISPWFWNHSSSLYFHEYIRCHSILIFFIWITSLQSPVITRKLMDQKNSHANQTSLPRQILNILLVGVARWGCLFLSPTHPFQSSPTPKYQS